MEVNNEGVQTRAAGGWVVGWWRNTFRYTQVVITGVVTCVITTFIQEGTEVRVGEGG